MSNLLKLKADSKAPSWLTEEGLVNLKNGYLSEDETPYDMYIRLAKAASSILNKPCLENKFYTYMVNGWLCPASPVLSNFGLERALPISCYSSYIGDSIQEIFSTVSEIALLSKSGGGTAFNASDIRGRNSPIFGGGKSEGVVPWLKVFDSTILSVNQGGFRKGAGAAYLNIEHVDINEFIRIRRPNGDVNRQCLNLHHGIIISDTFMAKLKSGDSNARTLWSEILLTRFETGEPYLIFEGNANRANPPCYKVNNLSVKASNLCCEIFLHTDQNHTFVCCLSSLNLSKYTEWKDTDLVETAIWFLDAVMQEFIIKSENIPGLERARRFAIKSRALGLGVLGWHSLLQSQMIPFDSLKASLLNKVIFKQIKEQSDKATANLALEYGEPEWCKGFGVRNSHRIAIAPTVSNSAISGGVSQGIEPLIANAFIKKGAKGAFSYRNTYLESLLEIKGKNTDEIWRDIIINEGSVQQLEFLSKEEKNVFLTARELNQMAIIKQAGDRQIYIDQGQSLNLFFPIDADPSLINKVHLEAYKQGLKSLYYVRTGSALKGDVASRAFSEECKACQG